MTVTHVVSFRFAEHITQAQRQGCFDRFLKLKGECRSPKGEPYVLSIIGGRENISPEGASKGFDQTFVVTFQNIEDVNWYLTEDPVHVGFGAFAKSLIQDAFVYDFETESTS